jgi:transposase InsO family protein
MSHVRPFTNVGIDYFGPFHVVVGRHQEKRYGVLFTCLSTRAVHLELAHHLTSDSFILAFRRFVDRRGTPAVVYSDNGTNLCAGEKEMRAELEEINKNLQLAAEKREIEWRFSPPSAPHFGGVWERLVRCCKSALTHVLHGQTVSDEILHTALTEVESLLNGRPLTHISVDPNDPTPLTPNHFLLGGPHPNLPISIISPGERLSSKSWRRAQQITDHFWKRWLTEYVPNLTERIKWTRNERALQVGDLVLVADKSSERGTWPVGRVTRLMPGKDGVVRTAVVKTQHGEYTRPVIKLFVFRETDAPTA